MNKPSAAKTAEGQISNDIILLLERQRTESVTSTLVELRAQLLAIYNGKSNKELDTCQVGLALADMGLGDHDEARRLLNNALKIAGDREFVVNNALASFANMGDFTRAHSLAVETLKRYPGAPSILERCRIVFEDTLDFAASADAIVQMLKCGDEQFSVQFLEQRKEFMLALASKGEDLNYSAADLTSRAQFVSDVLRKHGRKIYWTALRGTRVSSASLEFFVDAAPEVCADLNYVAAEALFEKFGERTAVDLLPFSVRSHVGMPNLSAQSSAAVAV
jgi:tetratricopeptide (TPR) repeat protein